MVCNALWLSNDSTVILSDIVQRLGVHAVHVYKPKQFHWYTLP